MVRLTDHPDMTLDVYRGRKTTTQQQQQFYKIKFNKTINKLYHKSQTQEEVSLLNSQEFPQNPAHKYPPGPFLPNSGPVIT